eukprot:c15336_g1_i1.p1 GENE.c15336_g1_i1~~c15336_g1_i1.p1  ORF type:complete len:287 (+),score=35.75 c15336_g1_i1:35-862(+)
MTRVRVGEIGVLLLGVIGGAVAVALGLKQDIILKAFCALLGLVLVFARGLSTKPQIRVKELWVFPVKGCRGVQVTEAKLDFTGFENDRKWIITTPEGKLVSQRDNSRMSLIQVKFAPTVAASDRTQIELSAPQMQPLLVPLTHPGVSKEISVKIWKDTCQALDTGDESAEWLTTYLGSRCCLVECLPGRQHSRPISDPAGKFANLTGTSSDQIQVTPDTMLIYLFWRKVFFVIARAREYKDSFQIQIQIRSGFGGFLIIYLSGRISGWVPCSPHH